MTEKKPDYLDRLRHNVTGQTATILRLHTEKGHNNATVMIDDGNRADPATTPVWNMDDCTWMPPMRGKRCPKCDGRHLIFYCPDNAPPPREDR